MSLSRPLRVSVSLSLFRCATILALDQFFSKQHVKEIIMIGFVYLYVCLYVCVCVCLGLRIIDFLLIYFL
jgi:hypothetical protein